MFNFFKKKDNSSESKKAALPLVDINGLPLQAGDLVEVLRYEMGRSRVIATEKGYAYQSLETGQEVSWLRMIDASTNYQKVKKIIEKPEA